MADCKAAAIETRATIAQEGGRYLFPVPLTGKTPEELAAWIRQPPAEPRDIVLDAEAGAAGEGKCIGRGFEVEKTLTVELGQQTYQWKERWLVIRSDNHAKRQKKKLIKQVETAEKEIKQLYPKATEGAEELTARANKVIEKHGVSDFLSVAISERISYRKRYLKRGRPGQPARMNGRRSMNISAGVSGMKRLLKRSVTYWDGGFMSPILQQKGCHWSRV